MLHHVVLVRTDVSEECRASITRATRIGALGMLAVVTLMMEALRSTETSVLTRTTQPNIQEDGIVHSYRHENLKSYIAHSLVTLYQMKGPLIFILLEVLDLTAGLDTIVANRENGRPCWE
jgi:hypothetical protein